MKKLIFFTALLGLCLITQAQTNVITAGMNGAELRTAVNNTFGEVLGVVDTVNERININGVAVTSNGAEINVLDGILVTTTEINRLSGVSGNIQTQLNGKQATLVSGTNIKTVNGSSILGSGDLTVSGSGGTWGSITGTLSEQTDLNTALSGKEASLGNPGTNGYVLSSTSDGTRSWIENGSGVSGFTPDGGSLTLSGADAITLSSTAGTSLTLPTTGTLATTTGVSQVVSDSLQARIGAGTHISDIAVMLADSTGGPGHYASHDDMVTGLAGKQASDAGLTALANLADASGVLTNNGSGTFSWAAGGGSMVYPGAGVPISTGSAWGTSVSTVDATELGYVDGVTSAIQTQLNAKAPLNITFNAQTGTSYTLVIGDAYKTVTMSNTSANTLTIPPNSSVAFPVGTQITVVQYNTGETSIAPGSGVTLNSARGYRDLGVQFSPATLLKTATDTWLLTGDIEQ